MPLPVVVIVVDDVTLVDADDLSADDAEISVQRVVTIQTNRTPCDGRVHRGTGGTGHRVSSAGQRLATFRTVPMMTVPVLTFGRCAVIGEDYLHIRKVINYLR